MAEHRGTIDRRTLLQLMGAAGASAIVMSGGGTPWGRSARAEASGIVQTDIEPFECHVSDDELEDLRPAAAGWPRRVGPGTPPAQPGPSEPIVRTWKSWSRTGGNTTTGACMRLRSTLSTTTRRRSRVSASTSSITKGVGSPPSHW